MALVVMYPRKRSPPARGRGLKLEIDIEERRDRRSPPARGRGLKLVGEAVGRG
ncbi:hypothetical protein SBDP2_380020 [Syntrophobacter sp. SbD2]|nr:hypothetical protein SBDP2_380020 [Syntrophobacter sp. SbD2]